MVNVTVLYGARGPSQDYKAGDLAALDAETAALFIGAGIAAPV